MGQSENQSIYIYSLFNNFRFPRDKERRRLWEQAVDRRDWTSTASSTVCSEHFEAGDFYLTESGLRRLAIDCVPSINISVSI